MSEELKTIFAEKLMDVWDAAYMEGVSDAYNGKVILPDKSRFEDRRCGGGYNNFAPRAIEAHNYLIKCVDEVLHIK